jgi:hypothetical protein
MKLKDMVIRICDYLCYIIFALVCITAFLTGMVNPIHGAVVGIVGLILFSLMAGLWFVLSSISDSAQRQAMLTEKQNKLLEKIYKQGEANIELQFPNE